MSVNALVRLHGYEPALHRLLMEQVREFAAA
jgi:hypothetical protein